MPPSVYAIATFDTKGHELAFVANAIRRSGAEVTTVDVGTGEAPVTSADVARESVAACHPHGAAFVLEKSDRGEAVGEMSQALVAFLLKEHNDGRVAGVIGLGGTGGTALIAPALRALPIGLPKLLVSTVASGNTAQYVGCCDVTLMPSVVDVAGLNRVSRQVLSNAAHAIAGMVAHRAEGSAERPAVGVTMFGVTTPCVTAVRATLEAEGNDVLVFHATGTGGQAMEKLVESGLIGGVLDVTTTEVADEVVGGVFRAGPARFDIILDKHVPYVLSVGALDMVNFGSLDTVPPEFRKRNLHVHNAQVTLMRTTPDESRQFARWIAAKLNRSSSPLILLIPEGGVSALDAPNMPFWDPAADAALFDELESAIQRSSARQIRRLPLHINDPAFAKAVVTAYHEVSVR
ncbi:MAG: Tm-1-like ATP-binding domain-containing protein [Planctomycetota bacterium]|nr:Tm-1-like ATP-binding domain-containing protein [Planctomycetaceae bacterium]MDQ3331241.1 Tm-1-like ATP-binding domain-containing protein [Planctomycetota bacterium]